MNIKPEDLVLEVGSGNNPNPRSNILVDRYIFNNGQRAGEFRIVIDRPLVVADGYKLPFKNKSFDYVICSHILEHLTEPEKFLKEVMRVGKAGYIEVPSDLSEQIFGWNFHLWYCSLEKGTLTLRKKIEGERFNGFFHRLIADHIWFRRFFEEHEDAFYITYEWLDRIKIRVDRSRPSQKWLSELDSQAWALMARAREDKEQDLFFYFLWMKRRILKKLTKIIRKFRWQIKIFLLKDLCIDYLLQDVVCPRCSLGDVYKHKKEIVCSHCGSTFPLVGVIPVMLFPAERKKGF